MLGSACPFPSRRKQPRQPSHANAPEAAQLCKCSLATHAANQQESRAYLQSKELCSNNEASLMACCIRSTNISTASLGFILGILTARLLLLLQLGNTLPSCRQATSEEKAARRASALLVRAQVAAMTFRFVANFAGSR